MEYREFPPIPPLAAAVDRIWLLEGDSSAEASAEPILPDGRPELILHFGDPFERLYVGGRSARQEHVLYAGQVTSPLVLRPTGRVAVVGVRFRPHGAAAILTHPQHELAGLTLGVEAISEPLRRALLAVEESADDLTQAAAAVQSVLVRWLQPSRIDARVRFAVEQIERTRGQTSVDDLAAATGITRRHLERRFLDSVGVTPKRLARVTRFQHALQTLRGEGSRGRGAATAAACGYADQSHFIRDFREFAGCSPAQHLLRDGVLTGFFIDR